MGFVYKSSNFGPNRACLKISKPNFMLKTGCLHFIICFVVFSSCTVQRANRIVYETPAANVPNLTKKGDAKVTGYFSLNGVEDGIGEYNPQQASISSTGYDVQAAFAITDNWTVLGGYSQKYLTQVYKYDSTLYRPNYSPPGSVTPSVFNGFDSSVIKYHTSVFQLGAGYNLPLNHRKTITFSWYAGFDFGKLTMNDAGLDSARKAYTRYYSVKTVKPWLQAAFNFGNSTKPVSLSIGGRLSILSYNSPTTNYSYDEFNYFYLNKLNTQSFLLLEPWINAQAMLPGVKWLRLDGQICLSNNFGVRTPKTSTINGSIGLTANLANFLGRSKKQ